MYHNTNQNLIEILARGLVGFHGTVGLPFPTASVVLSFPDWDKMAESFVVVLSSVVDTLALGCSETLSSSQ